MPVVVIVGRPNAGKSTLFNALIGEWKSIVGPKRGITRDRIFGRWTLAAGLDVDLVDTGGFDTRGDIDLSEGVLRQTMTAIEEAHLVVCLFDGSEPPTPDDRELVDLLRKKGKPAVYAVNKVDDPSNDLALAAFYELGIDDPVAVSARNRLGLADLAEAVRLSLGEATPARAHEGQGLRVGILGRPNVGKSLMLNRITGSERALVSPVAGTTRDSVDTTVVRDGKTYTFVDTAGIRRRSRREDSIEFVSVTRALRTIERSDVCLLVLDAAEGLTDQDKRLCGAILDRGRALGVVVNKVDLVDEGGVRLIRESLQRGLSFMPGLPVLFVSALTGAGLDRVYPLADELFAKATTRVPTARLNRFLKDITSTHSGPMVGGKQLKILYITQVDVAPPRFQVVVNTDEAVPRTYARFLANSLRKACGLEEVPVEIRFVPRRHKRRAG